MEQYRPRQLASRLPYCTSGSEGGVRKRAFGYRALLLPYGDTGES
jgi:hypothetical protein